MRTWWFWYYITFCMFLMSISSFNLWFWYKFKEDICKSQSRILTQKISKITISDSSLTALRTLLSSNTMLAIAKPEYNIRILAASSHDFKNPFTMFPFWISILYATIFVLLFTYFLLFLYFKNLE